jgi:hypothetical protein
MSDAQQILIDRAGSRILLTEELLNSVSFCDGGFRVLKPLTVVLPLKQSMVSVKFVQGFYPLSDSGFRALGFYMQDSSLLEEALEGLQEGGMITIIPTKLSNIPTKQSGGILLSFFAFIFVFVFGVLLFLLGGG